MELYPDSRYTLGNFFFGVNPSPVFRGLLPEQTFSAHNVAGEEELVHTLRRPQNSAEWFPTLVESRRPIPPLTPARLAQTPPDIRFHYRLRAAGLMLQAAALTTSPRLKAIALHIGGSWIRFRDRAAADRLFFKPLVKGCRGVDLGDEAARHGCFPQNPSPWLRQQLIAAAPPLKSIADIPARLIAPAAPKAKPAQAVP